MYSQTHVLLFDFQLLNQSTVNALLSFAMCLAGGQVLGCRHQEVIVSFHGNEICCSSVFYGVFSVDRCHTICRHCRLFFTKV